MCGSFTSLPHGVYTLIPIVLSTLGWMLALAQDGCNYIKLTGPIVQSIPSSHGIIPFLEIGFSGYRIPSYDENTEEWYINYSQSCNNYNDDAEGILIDSYWQAGKGFAFLALVFGGGGTVFLWFSSCVVFSKGTWKCNGYLLVMASLFQVCTFIWFKTELCQTNTCSLNNGSKSDLISTSLWLLSGIFILCKYPNPKDYNYDAANAIHQSSADNEFFDDEDENQQEEHGNNINTHHAVIDTTDACGDVEANNNNSSSNSIHAEQQLQQQQHQQPEIVVASFVGHETQKRSDNKNNNFLSAERIVAANATIIESQSQHHYHPSFDDSDTNTNVSSKGELS